MRAAGAAGAASVRVRGECGGVAGCMAGSCRYDELASPTTPEAQHYEVEVEVEASRCRLQESFQKFLHWSADACWCNMHMDTTTTQHY